MSGPRTNGHITALRQLMRLAGPARVSGLLALMLLASLTEGFGLLMLVPLTQIATDTAATDTASSWLGVLAGQPLAVLLAIGAGLVIVRALIVFLANEARRALGLSITHRLREETHAAILGAEWRWLARRNSADHAALIMGEAQRVGALADQSLTIVTIIATLAALLVAGLLVSPLATLVLLVAGILIAAPLLVIRARRARSEIAYAAAYVALQRIVSAGLAHIRAARIAGAQKSLAKQFSSASQDLTRDELVYFRNAHRALVVFQAISAIFLAVMLYFALERWDVPLVVLIPMLAICARAVPLLGSLQQATRGWHHARPALDVLFALADEARAHQEPVSSTDDLPARRIAFERDLRFDDVSLRYEGRGAPVFEGFHLVIPARAIVAVTGPSGSGKSSLADLAAGLLVPDTGHIAIDGVPLDPAARMRWRSQAAYLEQVPYFFDGTIAENLAWGVEAADDARMETALISASARFALMLPEGLETPMGETGRRFSGGERQRLSLARALMREPDLLILDEVTTALDAENAASVRRSIAALRGRTTILLLTHDARLCELADTVVDLSQQRMDGSDG